MRLELTGESEVGASERAYDREFILDTLKRRQAALHDDPWVVQELARRQLATDVYLVTHLLLQDGSVPPIDGLVEELGLIGAIYRGTIVRPGG